jgi:hypothetical protein
MQWRRKSNPTPADADAQFKLGLIEALLAFGVALADRGLISRAELAGTFRALVDQQRRDMATIGTQAEFEARASASVAMAEFFRVPVIDPARIKYEA